LLIYSLSAYSASNSLLGLAASVNKFKGLNNTSTSSIGYFYSLTIYSLTTSSKVQNSSNYNYLSPEAVKF
jgi:hypothetical protein